MANSAFDVALGNKIRLARAEARVSQRMLADRVGSTHNAISQYEHGTRSISLQLLVSIARELEKPLNYFLEPCEDLVIVKDSKLGEVIADLQSSNDGINLLHEICQFMRYRRMQSNSEA